MIIEGMNPLVTIEEIDQAIEEQNFGVALDLIVVYYEWRLQGARQPTKAGVGCDRLVAWFARTVREMAWPPPRRGRFMLGEGQSTRGDMVPAWGFDFGDRFIVDAKVSASGGTPEEPAHYGLTQEEVDELDRLNVGRGLL